MIGPLLGTLAHMALAIWVGSIVFFSFISAPVLFRTFDREDAGRAVRAIFPAYYRLGAVCGAISVIAVALRALMPSEPTALRGLEAIVGASMLALTMYAWRILLPRVDGARVRAERHDPTDPTNLEQRYFKRLHARSVRINAVVLILGILCLTLSLLPK